MGLGGLHRADAWPVDIEELFMTKEEALDFDLALDAAYLAGFNASGEGYNGEYPFRDHGAHPEQDAGWIKNRDNELTAIKQARALDKKAENARALGLDYEPVQPVAFEVGLVEWVGNKLMATPKVTTTPPAAQRQWVGLTVEEKNEITWGKTIYEILNLFEAKLKEKNT